MKIVFKKNNTTLLHAVFALWLFCELMFEHTIISQCALMLFVGVTVVVTNRPAWSIQLAGYGALIIWSVLNIYLGHAEDVGIAWSMTRTLILNFVFLYAFVCYCRYTKDIRSIFKIYAWIALLFSIPCVIGGIGAVLQGGRLSIVGSNPNRIAKTFAYTVIILFYQILNTSEARKRKQLLLLISWLMLMILLTGSRKGLLIPLLGGYVLVCARNPRKILMYTARTAVVGVAVWLLIINIDSLYELIGYRVEAVMQYLKQEDYNEGSLATRDSFVLLGWELSQEQPIWGHGLDCFRLLLKSFGTYSHNNYIEILYSLGWVGLIIYYMPFLITLGRLLKNLNKHNDLVCVLLSIFIPHLVCDYMNVTYFERSSLLIPAMVMISIGKKGLTDETETVY